MTRADARLAAVLRYHAAIKAAIVQHRQQVGVIWRAFGRPPTISKHCRRMFTAAEAEMFKQFREAGASLDRARAEADKLTA